MSKARSYSVSNMALIVMFFAIVTGAAVVYVYGTAVAGFETLDKHGANSLLGITLMLPFVSFACGVMFMHNWYDTSPGDCLASQDAQTDKSSLQ